MVKGWFVIREFILLNRKLIYSRLFTYIMYVKFFKRFIDLFAAFWGLIFLSPIFISVAIALFIVNNGYPFFIQDRPGRNGRTFKIIKFKSMNDKRYADGSLLPDEDRLTKVGSWVRKMSLDEIPQLINILKGDMSLVGPRPLLVDYMRLYNTEQKKRHQVRPGITGWAQVNGRNALSWKEKFEFDVWYVGHVSFLLDIKILILTFNKVFSRDGISQNGHATMKAFQGNK